jgi:hypothetical protein
LVRRRAEFPGLVSYNRFIALTPTVIIPLPACLPQRQGNCAGLAFVDATAVKVRHNKRIPRHKVFAGIAARGKAAMGWFYGFKLRLSVNDRGEIPACQLTPVNVELITPKRKNMKKPPLPLPAALGGQIVVAETIGYLDHQRPTEEHFPNRTHPPSQCD